MNTATVLREHLARALDWTDAHANYDAAVEDMPHQLQGVRPPGFPHSAWELLEHMRIAQANILEFCLPGPYHELQWPEQYWPPSPAPPTPQSWDESASSFRADREALKRLALDPDVDLFSVVPHGTDQTYLREFFLVVDHTAYHVGQLILVRRGLGAWLAA